MASVHAAHDGGRHRLWVDWAGVGTCGRVFASGARFWKGQGRRCSGKGPGKECVRFLTRVGNVQGRGGICSQMCQRELTQKRMLLGRAAHMSSFSTQFSLMQLAMMMADATPGKSLIFSVGFVPLSSSI